MKKALGIACLMMAAGLSQAETRIAVLDQNAALFGSAPAQAETAKLQSEYGSDEQRIKTLEGEVTDLQKKLETDSAIMSKSEQQESRQTINEKMTERAALVDKLEKIQRQRQQQFIQKYQPVMAKAIRGIVDKDKIDLVVQSQAVIYAGETINITKAVQDSFNDLVKKEK